MFGLWPQSATPKLKVATRSLASVWFSIQLRYATATESSRHKFSSQKVWRTLADVFAAAARRGAPQPTKNHCSRNIPRPSPHSSFSERKWRSPLPQSAAFAARRVRCRLA
ncbi:hypothetical protein SORBI_3003G097600 [Sorghum bicolor]|nr:hypothetical protein SORBI_3003G097600 [Sorghum bicolor]